MLGSDLDLDRLDMEERLRKEEALRVGSPSTDPVKIANDRSAPKLVAEHEADHDGNAVTGGPAFTYTEPPKKEKAPEQAPEQAKEDVPVVTQPEEKPADEVREPEQVSETPGLRLPGSGLGHLRLLL